MAERVIVDQRHAFEFTFGLEEEFFLTQPESRRLATVVPRSLLRACRRRFGQRVAAELLRSQVELVSPVFERHEQAAEEMARLRRGIAEIAADAKLRLTAAGTHPLAAWRTQLETPKARYRELVEDFQILGRRNVLCGLHVHVAVPAAVDRVQLMNRVMHWLPVFLALSTSSPFWNRTETGLLSYRQSAYDEWPRTGIPDQFHNEADYARLVELLALKDASYLWWAIRPALRYPTLELRICDACTRLEDSLAIAALYRGLVCLLTRRPDLAPPWSVHTRRLIDENRWRAKRFGIDAQFISHDGRAVQPCKEVVLQLLDRVAEEASPVGGEAGLARVRALLDQGTSAQAQLALYQQARAEGKNRMAALKEVVDWLIETTVPPAGATRHDAADLVAA